jgi:hypothetical protein
VVPDWFQLKFLEGNQGERADLAPGTRNTEGDDGWQREEEEEWDQRRWLLVVERSRWVVS